MKKILFLPFFLCAFVQASAARYDNEGAYLSPFSADGRPASWADQAMNSAAVNDITVDRKYIKETSSVSFDHVDDLAKYLEENYGERTDYSEIINIVTQVYPEFPVGSTLTAALPSEDKIADTSVSPSLKRYSYTSIYLGTNTLVWDQDHYQSYDFDSYTIDLSYYTIGMGSVSFNETTRFGVGYFAEIGIYEPGSAVVTNLTYADSDDDIDNDGDWSGYSLGLTLSPLYSIANNSIWLGPTLNWGAAVMDVPLEGYSEAPLTAWHAGLGAAAYFNVGDLTLGLGVDGLVDILGAESSKFNFSIGFKNLK